MFTPQTRRCAECLISFVCILLATKPVLNLLTRKRSMSTTRKYALRLLALGMIFAISVTNSKADPLTGRDLLKFTQQPMNTTFIVNTTGTVNLYKGHDEPSTAYGF